MTRQHVICPQCATPMDIDDCARIDGKWVEQFVCPTCRTKRNIIVEPRSGGEPPQIRKPIQAVAPTPPPEPALIMGEEPEAPKTLPEYHRPETVIIRSSDPPSLPSVAEFEALAEARRILEAARSWTAHVRQTNGHVFLETMLERAMVAFKGENESRDTVEELLRDDEYWTLERRSNPERFIEYPLA